MRNYFIALLLVFVANLNAQEEFYYSGWGKIRDSAGYKVSPKEIRAKYANNYEILEFYNSGRTKQAFGNALIVGGSVFIVAPLAAALYGPGMLNTTPMLAGAVMLVLAVPIKIGFKKKMEYVVDRMNDLDRRPKQANIIDNTMIIANSNGVGLSITF